MNDLDKARGWAERVYAQEPDTQATCRVILSLPDQWVDADKLRDAIKSLRDEGDYASDNIADDLESLLPVPPLPTLAELIGQGNDPQQYQWVQCDDDPGYVIMQVGETVSRVLLSDGNHMVRGNRTITPLPDAPKLVWPSLSVSGEGEAVSVETEESECPPRPEDVPAGEPWLVKCTGSGFGGEWIGTRSSNPDRNYPWMLTKPHTQEREVVQDSKVTLVSRLVPEHKENA